MIRFARVEDTEVIVNMRIALLKGVVSNEEEIDWIEYGETLKEYYSEALEKEEIIGGIFQEDDMVKSIAIMNLYRITPSPANTSGKMAVLSDMFTIEKYRGQGLGYSVLDAIMNEVKKRGYHKVVLNSTEAGRSLYEKYGFEEIQDEMVYKF